MNKDNAKEFLVTFLLSGTIAMTTKTIVAPLERTKSILQNQESAYQVLTGERKRYIGVVDIFRRVPKEQGWLSFWRGNGVNLIRTFPTMAFNFAFNDMYNKYLSGLFDTKQNFAVAKVLSGGLAGVTTGTILYPLEFCQTKITSDFGSDKGFKTDKVAREYTGLFNCVGKVYRKEGYKGYFKGWHVEILGIFLYRGLYFGLYEMLKQAYLVRKERTQHKLDHIPFFANFVIATTTTIVSSFTSYPLDTIGRRLMLDSARPAKFKQFKNARDAMFKMHEKHGITSFYKGALVNSVRGVSSALVLVMYDQILIWTNWKSKLKAKN
ncbi:unnamed protein product [Brassicogethes aeneus]|uniref:ADP/ATP translocase n=1 Tax=Brassicogethes aeneus TaxID=1431903 RepID=A0A9P0BLV2_BRAAE|nr:unnamed protein product [Brassicogethes aeneus]